MLSRVNKLGDNRLMRTELKNVLVEGLIKLANKAKKKAFVSGGQGRPGVVQGRNKLQGKDYHSRRDSHDANRGKKTKGMMEAALIEGLTKKINKARKGELEGSNPKDKANFRANAKSSITQNNTAKGHAALTAAGAMRKGGSVSTAKLFLKASKRHRKGQDFTAQENTKFNTFKSKLLTVVSKLLFEGRDDTETDSDSIKNAGGDSDTYAKIKAAKGPESLDKQKRTTAKADVKTLAIKHSIEPRKNYKTGKSRDVSRGDFRRNILGNASAAKYKDGKQITPKNLKPKSPKSSDGNKSKPLPLNLKGKPKPGKKVLNVRAKAVNTSRSTGQEGAKAQANSDAFDKFYTKLSNFKKQ